MKHTIFLMFFLAKFTLNAQIVPDLPIVIEFHHPEGYKDSVVIGLSLNADEGFDEGLDIIDTTEMQFPLDVRIFDPLVMQQIGGPDTHNLKHAYLSIPKPPKGEIRLFEREFIVVVKTDSINFQNKNIDGCNEGNNDPAGLGSTFFKINTDNLVDYTNRNTEGWNISSLDVYNTQLYLGGALDRIELRIPIYDNYTLCCGLNEYENIYNEIYLKFTLRVFNNLYVGISNNKEKPLVQFQHNVLTIETQNPYNGYSFLIFDINGGLAFSKFNVKRKYYKKKLELNSNMVYFLNVLNGNGQITYYQKFIMQ